MEKGLLLELKKEFPQRRDGNQRTGGHVPYVGVTVTHGLAKVGVHTTGVGVLDLGLGAHLWRGDMLHTHVHKACGGRRDGH